MKGNWLMSYDLFLARIFKSNQLLQDQVKNGRNAVELSTGCVDSTGFQSDTKLVPLSPSPFFMKERNLNPIRSPSEPSS
jgi:hypothetical protein